MNPTDALLTLSEVAALGPERVGGKAWGLARLAVQRLRVPPTLVLLAVDGAPVPPPPADLAARLGPGPYFVRSSFVGEDAAGASYAGQGLTLSHLDRNDVAAAVAAVWASWENAHGRAYRARHGGAAQASGSVVVQREIVPVWSGVIFTRSPEAVGDWARIEAAKGYGEAVVGGRVRPQVFELEHTSGHLLGTCPPPLMRVLRLMRRSLRRLEAAVGGPADAEWCLDTRGRLWWLQVRPAVIAPPDLWSAVLAEEFWSGQVSRLMFATVGTTIERTMLREPLSVLEPDPPPLLRRYGGRVYVHAGMLARAFKLIPAWAHSDAVLAMLPPVLRERIRREAGAHRPWIPRQLLQAARRFIRLGFPWQPWRQPLAAKRLRRAADAWRDRPVPATRGELVAEIDHLLADLGATLRWVTWGMLYAYVFLPLLDRLLGPRAQAAGAGVLLANLPRDPVAALDRDLRAYAATLPADMTDVRAAPGFAELLARWAHRAEDRDVSAARLEDAPEGLVQLLRLAVSAPPTPPKAWWRWLLKDFRPWRVRDWLRAPLLLGVAATARTYLGFRECMRDIADRYLLALRRRLLALARLEGDDAPWAWGWTPGVGFDRSPDPDYGTAVVARFLHGDVPLAAAEYDPDALTGQAVSAGIARGRAVWLRGAGDLAMFKPGDVLLALYLDPSLSLVLEVAAAAAFVYGGMLSHGAILAREYGVPAVVGVAGLETIRTGALVEVDAVAGAVRVLEP